MFLYLVNVCSLLLKHQCAKYAQCVYSIFWGVFDKGVFAGVIQLQGLIVKSGGGGAQH